jgi:uncharacterized membrane protein
MTMSAVIHCLYTLVLALWVGGISLFTFIVTPAIFRSFGRDMAGEVVGKLFPGYFSYTLLLSLLALILFLALRPSLGRPAYTWSMLLIALAIMINIFVSFRLHPEIKRIKQEVLSFAAAQDSPLRKKFRQLHGVSATLNLILLADGVALLVVSTLSRK